MLIHLTLFASCQVDGGLLSYGEARQCSKSRLPPLFKADTATLTFARHADGKIRVALGGGRADRPGRGVRGIVTAAGGAPDGLARRQLHVTVR